uniref:C2H2-type domain-containing protein n=1 Tax=Romanomermis culicivorax TaxID=13658 RepID=A0A915KK96_ROMCU
IFGFNILQHLSNAHKFQLNAAEILYTCDLCRQRLYSFAALQWHLKNVHEQKNPAATVSRNLTAT